MHAYLFHGFILEILTVWRPRSSLATDKNPLTEGKGSMDVVNSPVGGQ
jgi:hypothetical protein